MAHYIFNVVSDDDALRPVLYEQVSGLLRARMWGIDADEPHRNALAAGDLILLYLGAPERKFIGRAELPRRPTSGHGQSGRCTPAIPLAVCCWLRSRNGTRLYR